MKRQVEDVKVVNWSKTDTNKRININAAIESLRVIQREVPNQRLYVDWSKNFGYFVKFRRVETDSEYLKRLSVKARTKRKSKRILAKSSVEQEAKQPKQVMQ